MWFEPEAIYCNNTWWETLQDDGSEASELGSLDVPGQPHAPINWAGPELPFFIPTHAAYLPDPQDTIKPTIPSTPPHMSPLIGLTMTTSTNVSTKGIVPSTTTCTSAATNNGSHVDHTIWAHDKACYHNHTCDGYTQTATGSYHHGVSITFIDDTPIGHMTKKKHNKHALKCG
jgi:hypothetical protein